MEQAGRYERVGSLGTINLVDRYEALQEDHELALRHGVIFTVTSRPAGYSRRSISEHGRQLDLPVKHGSFLDPMQAVALARSLVDRDVTVLADGHGPYWYTRRPAEVSSELLVRVCREKVLGQEEAQRDHKREELRRVVKQLSAEQQIPEAVGIIGESADAEGAIQALQGPPLRLSEDDARHLVGLGGLRRLTKRGQAEVADELAEALAALEELGPSPVAEL